MKFANETLNMVAALGEESVKNSRANDAPILSESLLQNKPPIETRPLFQVLKGYSLFKQDIKLHAIVDFLSLSSHTSLLLTKENDLHQ